jgi:diguanylate cyclase (GGDEF)-like protein/PAS domain S-box-containing protein
MRMYRHQYRKARAVTNISGSVGSPEAAAYTLSKLEAGESHADALDALVEMLHLVRDLGPYTAAAAVAAVDGSLEPVAVVTGLEPAQIPGTIPHAWNTALATLPARSSDPDSIPISTPRILPLGDGARGQLIIARTHVDSNPEDAYLIAWDESHGPIADAARTFLPRLASLVGIAIAGERRRQHRNRSFQALLEHLRESITIMGPDGDLIYESPAARRMLGYESGVIDGYDEVQLAGMIHPSDWEEVARIVNALIAEPERPQTGEYRARHADGSWRWLSAYATNMTAEPAIGGFVYSTVDITERKHYEARLEYEANHDFLTGIPNRAALERDLDQRLAAGDQVSVLYVDLDGFHGINSAYGHAAGDGVLREIAHRLDQQRRPEEIVCRFGGDEFLLLVPTTDARTIRRRAQSFLGCFRHPCRVGDRIIPVRASIGISRTPNDGDDLSSLYRAADRALYRVKDGNPGQIAVFNQRVDGDLTTSDTLAREVLAAVSSGDLQLYFQPILNLTTHEAVSYEGLIRWNHPLFGLLTPRDILPMADEFGYGDLLARVCIKEAIAGVQQLGASIAFNLSANQLHSQDLLHDFSTAIRDAGVDPSRLIVEVTEAAAIIGQDDGALTLDALHGLGIRIAIDDFGTGYSDLAALRTYPIDILKVDRSFIAALDSHNEDYALLTAILSIATALDLEVVAEGIETEEQLHAVTALGCQMGQGYLLGRPQPREQLIAAVRKYKRFSIPDDEGR